MGLYGINGLYRANSLFNGIMVYIYISKCITLSVSISKYIYIHIYIYIYIYVYAYVYVVNSDGTYIYIYLYITARETINKWDITYGTYTNQMNQCYIGHINQLLFNQPGCL